MPDYPPLASSRTYAILGTGALGGFYGARLQQAGMEVHFLLRSDYEPVRQQGLQVESPQGNFVLPHVHAYHDVHEMPSCDVVVVALKMLQNGLGIESEVAAIVGSERVMGGLCFLCSNKIGPGQIRHLDYGQITLGDYAVNDAPCGITERMQQIASDFQQAGIAIELSEDLLLARWKKLVWNIPFNGLSVVLNATTQEMMASEPIRALATQLMQEVLTGAAACLQRLSPEQPNRIIPFDFIATMLDYTQTMKPYRTSMKIDFDERRPLEIAAIFGQPLRSAQQAGVELPHIQMLYRQLQFLDTRNRSC